MKALTIVCLATILSLGVWADEPAAPSSPAPVSVEEQIIEEIEADDAAMEAERIKRQKRCETIAAEWYTLQLEVIRIDPKMPLEEKRASRESARLMFVQLVEGCKKAEPDPTK